MVERTANIHETDKSSVNYSETAPAQGSSYNDFFSVDAESTDGVSHEGETVWQPEWTKWHGYYNSIPEFAAVINKLGTWTFGKGIKADKKNKDKLKRIRGNGKGTPRGVLKNQWKVAMICGDSTAEIVEDKQGRMTNLKPLPPGAIVTVLNDSGIIIRYEQTQVVEGKNKSINKWDPDEIYHIQYEPIGDEIHGKPFAEKLVDLIEMRNEAMKDQKIVFHRYVKPIQVIEVATDDDAELNNIQTSFDTAYRKTENIIIPMGVVKQIERVSIPQFSSLDPLNWLKYLIRLFVTSAGVPEVVMGWGAETTEASSKVIFLAFVVDIKDYQGYNEEQIDIQLNIELKLPPPPDLEPEMKQDQKKDGDQKVKVGDAKKDTR